MSILRYKLSKLLDGTPESYYWIGFILADGHFSNNNRLHLTLSSKDEEHLDRFVKFLDSNIIVRNYSRKDNYSISSVSVMDKVTIQELTKRFRIVANKTQFPPDLSTLSKEELFCVATGFIDGDGSIQFQTGRKDAALSVKCHKSWLENLSLMYNKVAYVNNAGYAFVCLTDNTVLRDMKTKVVSLGLPILRRKWDVIDESKVSRYVKAKSTHSKVLELFLNGVKVSEISKVLKVKYSTAYNSLKRKGYI